MTWTRNASAHVLPAVRRPNCKVLHDVARVTSLQSYRPAQLIEIDKESGWLRSAGRQYACTKDVWHTEMATSVSRHARVGRLTLCVQFQHVLSSCLRVKPVSTQCRRSWRIVSMVHDTGRRAFMVAEPGTRGGSAPPSYPQAPSCLSSAASYSRSVTPPPPLLPPPPLPWRCDWRMLPARRHANECGLDNVHCTYS